AGAQLARGGAISDAAGPAGIIKQGDGTLVLMPGDPLLGVNKSNTYNGLTEVAKGVLSVLPNPNIFGPDNTPLGSTATGTTVLNGGTLELGLRGSTQLSIVRMTVSGEALTLQGMGAGGVGAL